MQFLNHFLTFEMDVTNTTFPSSSIAPKIRNCDITPAIFFSGKLQTPITCFPTRFSSL